MKKMLFVMNPYAGMRKANRYLADIIGLFNSTGHEVTCYMTAGPGDGARIVEEKAAGMDLVVCCGGDGTFNEVISGLMHSGLDIPVGYIPAGSTNDFASSLKLPTNIMQAAQNIVEGSPVRYDVGQFGDRYFSYVASFGAFTKTSYSTPQTIKNVMGHMAYLLEGIQELSQIKKEHVRLEMDDRVIEDDFLFGAISNSTSVGGVLNLDPKQVDMQDGKFEILLVRAPAEFGEISQCIWALQRREYNCAMVTFCSTSHVKVYAREKMPWTLDGEREDGHGEIDIQNIHGAIQIIQKEKEE